MALSAAARAALEKFRTQQGGSSVESEEDETPQSTYTPSTYAASQTANAAPNSAPAETASSAPTHTSTVAPAAERPQPKPEIRNKPMGMSGGSSSREGSRDTRMSYFTSGLLRPEQPKTFKESGISYRVVESLILKIIKQEGPRNEQQLSDFMKIGVNVFRDVLISLNKRELLDTPLPLHYDLTNKGRELVTMMEREDGYVGPAPVAFADYCEMVRQQSKREKRVTMDDVNEVFANYPMRDTLRHKLKEGFNSQRVMLYYGPPGNGKSLITDNLHRLLRNPVVLPYSFEFNGRVVQLYDPAYHKLREDLMQQEEEVHRAMCPPVANPTVAG